MRFSWCFLALGLLGLGGCAAMNKPVTMTDLRPPAQQYLVDRSPADSYPGFLAAEGNDFSCRYGIHFESEDEFTPPKAQLFTDLLAQDLPGITAHQVVLQRFDVYYNYRLKLIHTLGSAGLGGVVGMSVDQANQQVARQNMGIVVFDKLLIDTNPEVDRHSGQNQVGCDNAHEGEYYPMEISGGYDVVVSWFKFTVDGHPYEFRTFYQYQPQDKAALIAGIDEAIRMSIKGVAQKVELQPDKATAAASAR